MSHRWIVTLKLYLLLMHESLAYRWFDAAVDSSNMTEPPYFKGETASIVS